MCLLHGVVENIAGDQNHKFSLKVCNFFLVSATYPGDILSLFLDIYWVHIYAIFGEDNLRPAKIFPSLTISIKERKTQ